MRTRRRPPWWLHLAALPFVVLVVYAIVWLGDDQSDWIGLALLAAILFFIATLVGWTMWKGELRRQEAQALVDWAAPRGLALAQTAEPKRDATALTGGTVAFDTVVRGPIVADRAGTVSHLAVSLRRTLPLVYLVPFWGVAMEDSVDLWTMVQVALPREDLAGLGRVVLSRRDVLDLPALAAVRDRATALRSVELESAELHRVYELDVADRADDLAVRRMFSPAFVVFLVERAGEPLYVELRKQTLTVAQRGRLLQAHDLDRLLADARRVATAVAPRAATEPAAGPVAAARVPGLGRRGRLASIAVAGAILVGIFVVGASSLGTTS